MRKLFLTLLLIINCTASLYAAQTAPSVSMGEVPGNAEMVAGHIEIQNNEPNSIVLKTARSSCDCIIMSSSGGQTIKAGQSNTIEFQLLPAKLPPGKFKKFIFLEFENSQTPVIAVEVSGTIQ